MSRVLTYVASGNAHHYISFFTFQLQQQQPPMLLLSPFIFFSSNFTSYPFFSPLLNPPFLVFNLIPSSPLLTLNSPLPFSSLVSSLPPPSSTSTHVPSPYMPGRSVLITLRPLGPSLLEAGLERHVTGEGKHSGRLILDTDSCYA